MKQAFQNYSTWLGAQHDGTPQANSEVRDRPYFTILANKSVAILEGTPIADTTPLKSQNKSQKNRNWDKGDRGKAYHSYHKRCTYSQRHGRLYSGRLSHEENRATG
jgi:hypothetical protein